MGWKEWRGEAENGESNPGSPGWEPQRDRGLPEATDASAAHEGPRGTGPRSPALHGGAGTGRGLGRGAVRGREAERWTGRVWADPFPQGQDGRGEAAGKGTTLASKPPAGLFSFLACPVFQGATPLPPAADSRTEPQVGGSEAL